MKLFSGPMGIAFVGWMFAACQGSVSTTGGAPSEDDGAGSGSGRGGKGGGGSSPKGEQIVAMPKTCGEGPSVSKSRLRRLTREQYANAVKDLLGVDADTSGLLADTATGPFLTNALFAPGERHVTAYAAAAETLAKSAATNVQTLTKCGASADRACAQRFVESLGLRAYRRPLERGEVDALMAAFDAGREENFALGIQLVLEAVLQSPSFLYITEFGEPEGNGIAKLTGYEMASRLSFAFTNSMPSAELFEAAANGDLDTAEGVREYAEKLIGDKSQLARTAAAFHAQLLHVDAVLSESDVTKDTSKYPEWNGDLRKAMRDETHKFVEKVFTEEDGSLETLLTSRVSYPAGPLLKVYGISAGALGADGRYEFPENERAGLLTQPSVMAVEPAVPSRFSPVYRGNMVRTRILCQDVPDPSAMDADFTPPPNADRLTAQEILREHQKNPSCSGCHRLMDNIGFGFENYDPVGRYKTKAADGSEIDTAGNVLESDIEGDFRGPRELATKLASSGEVRLCFATQWFRYTLGSDPVMEEEGPSDICSVGAVANKLAEGKGDVREALLTLVSSDSFRYRRGGAQ